MASLPYFHGTVSVHTFVSVNRRDNEVRGANIAMLAPRFVIPSIYGSAKIWETRHKISVDIFAVYMALVALVTELESVGRVPSRGASVCLSVSHVDLLGPPGHHPPTPPGA